MRTCLAAVGAVQLTMEGSVADYDDAKIMSIKRDIAKDTGVRDINKIRITYYSIAPSPPPCQPAKQCVGGSVVGRERRQSKVEVECML